jgi:hypothetical protein
MLSYVLLCTILLGLCSGQNTLGLYTSTYTQSGDGTYYGGTSFGHCSISPLPSWASGLTKVAMNAIDYAGEGASMGYGTGNLTLTRQLWYVRRDCWYWNWFWSHPNHGTLHCFRERRGLLLAKIDAETPFSVLSVLREVSILVQPVMDVGASNGRPSTVLSELRRFRTLGKEPTSGTSSFKLGKSHLLSILIFSPEALQYP